MEVLRAEVLFTSFLVEHNLPLAVADHANNLFKRMFPDSKIAKGYHAARTKTRQLVGKLATETKAATVKEVQEHPFSLSTDGSNDKGSEQPYPILLRYHDDKKVKSSILAITTNSTGCQIFQALDVEIQKAGLSWDNCLSFGADNASVMLGRLNGVSACIKEKNDKVLIQGCPCHLLHIAAKQGASQLRCPIEERLIDVFYYLENSTKRLKALQAFQVETGTAIRKILKHGPTRWLSLLSCLERLLDQWDALTSFFVSEGEAAGTKISERLSRILSFFQCPSTKLYLLFFKFALPMFTKANLLFQREDPVLHLIQDRLHEVATDLLVAFIKPTVITESDDLFSIELQRRSKQKDREDLMIGEATRLYITKEKGKSITNTMVNNFYEDVRAFFGKSTQYIMTKLPMQKEELQHAVVMDVSKRGNQSFKNIRFWLERFPVLKKGVDIDCLQAEFTKYQVDKLEGLDMSARLDTQWIFISQMRDSSGLLKYPSLCQIIKGLLAIPRSNSDSERVFSLVRKNKTEARASMSRQLLEDIIVQKVGMLASGSVCHTIALEDSQLQKLK